MDEINPYATPSSALQKPAEFKALRALTLFTWAHVIYGLLVLAFSLLVLLAGRNAGDWTQVLSCMLFVFPVISCAQLSRQRLKLFLLIWLLQLLIFLFLLDYSAELDRFSIKMVLSWFFTLSNGLSLLGGVYFYWHLRQWVKNERSLVSLTVSGL
ncbi:hypothetical protein [Pseudomonas sp. ML96]|uniref:hypothetical protein n=1 Tax=Pseudomonas sp. ML96 TaxID=1523503 RepID=UPI0005B94508|nr:hypothetical protein [Pseudomonas sp. ML96]